MGVCACMCVLDGEGSMMVATASTVLVVIWMTVCLTGYSDHLTGYSDNLTGHSSHLTGYSDHLTGFHESLLPPLTDVFYEFTVIHTQMHRAETV